MPLDELQRGDKVDLHLKLYEREVTILDAHCRRLGTSRAAVIGQLILDSADALPDVEHRTRRGRPAKART